MRSRSSARESPTLGFPATSGGQSDVASTPTTRMPAPAAYSNSVACGARLTMRNAGAASVTIVPASSTACTAASAEGNTAGSHAASTAVRIRRIPRR